MNSFARICFANLLIFISQYMLIPVLPVVLAGELDISIASAGKIFLILTAGMILGGPFYNYLIDAYRRKYLCILSFCVVLFILVGYCFLNAPFELYILPLLQGVFLGILTSSLITIGIDIIPSDKRDSGNLIFGWVSRLGMIFGVALGSLVYLNADFQTVVVIAIGLGMAALLLLISVRVSFRAPIGVSVLSLDRFFLPESWILFLNMILIAFVIGVFFPLIHFKTGDLFLLEGWTIPYLAITVIGYFFSIALAKVCFKNNDVWKQIVLSLLAVVIAISLFILFDVQIVQVLSAFILGLAFGIITPTFLFLFINLSRHCQRCTANITYWLSWEIGISIGITVACYLHTQSNLGLAYQLAMFSGAFALILFIVASSPYYKRGSK